MLKQLIHNGILIPEPPVPLGLTLIVRGEPVALTPEQEEMAMAWARKKDTPYVRDEVFAANFMRDFSAALGVEPPLAVNEVNWDACIRVVEAERAAKERLSREERKELAATRKAQREALKAKYGYAIVDGQRVELGTYMSEPSGIFMGRGQHPLRGRWKAGAKQSDVTLNLSPDAPRPEGNWREIIWDPESMWVARWQDKLSGKLKYIWLSDTAPIKQEREAQKFDKAINLDAQIANVREQIFRDLSSENPRWRMVATVCYLIDALCLRVGDEKDPDEADTVGATTLRPEHVALREDGTVEFKFLGKDSVEWHKTLKPPQVVLDNLAELIRNARPPAPSNGDKNHFSRDKAQLFPDITSRDVNAYLSGIMPGLTAKVFRTHHATILVRETLAQSGVRAEDADYRKWQAVSLANLEAAVLCNHTKQVSRNWATTRARYRERIRKAEERLQAYRAQVEEAKRKMASLKQEADDKEKAAATPARLQKVRETYRRRIEKAREALEACKQKRNKAQIALDQIKAQAAVVQKKRAWNLGTSLKSYIDPRVYHRWGQQVNYDVLSRYYPAILQRKFAWVRNMDDDVPDSADDEETNAFVVRTCMFSDLPAVETLFRAVRENHPDLSLPQSGEEIARQYLPSLDKDWREAIIALRRDDEEVLGLVVVGPAWREDGQARLDLFGVLHPKVQDLEVVRLLANEVNRIVRGYRLHHPKEAYVMLSPRNNEGHAAATDLYVALGLVPEDEEETAPVDEPSEQAFADDD